jgi:hypothetical protein
MKLTLQIGTSKVTFPAGTPAPTSYKVTLSQNGAVVAETSVLVDAAPLAAPFTGLPPGSYAASVQAYNDLTPVGRPFGASIDIAPELVELLMPASLSASISAE